MIKLSVISDEISQDFARALDVALEHDIRHVELRGMWETNISDLSDDQVAQARELLDERDMQVVAIAGPVFKSHLDQRGGGTAGDTFHAKGDGSVEEHLAILERTFLMAEAFGTDMVRAFAFWRQGAPTGAVYDQIEKHLREAARRTEEAGLRLVLENEHACFIASASESVEILRRIPSKALGLIWDPGNAACLDPAGEVFPDGYDLIKKEVGFERIFHVHVKDSVTANDGTHFTEFGTGEIDYAGQLKALVADGYQGALSMETHWQGPGLSKEESTSLCLKGLWRIIDECGLRGAFS